MNPALAAWLGVPQANDLGEVDFWDRLQSLAANVEKARLDIEKARGDLVEKGLGAFGFLSRIGQHFQVELAVMETENGLGRGYAGWIRDAGQEIESCNNQINLLADICAGTRMAVSGIAGNIGAMLENFRVWNTDVMEEFLRTSAEEISQIQSSLDLVLSYAGLAVQTSVFRDSIDVGAMLKKLVRRTGNDTIRVAASPQIGENVPRARIDPALTTLALETLLQEVVRHHPPGIQTDIILDRIDEYLVVKLVSPRTLPLPGLGIDQGVSRPGDLPAKLLLVNRLLTSQGGRISFQDRPPQEGGGADIEIYLPVGGAPRFNSSKEDWENLGGRQEGRILVAEAQPDYQIPLRDALTDHGYRVDLAVEGSAALDMVRNINPDLVILARNLPGMDGLLVTQGIRRWSPVPLIMISARNNPDDRLYAYQLGVDDYLPKPFLIEELLAKARVFISREQAQRRGVVPEIYQSGSVRIDHSLRRVWVRGNRVELTPIEYNLLVYLSRQGRQIITYEQLLESVWEGPEKGTRQGLFVHVRRLRQKIEADPKNPQILKNKWGVGYVFTP